MRITGGALRGRRLKVPRSGVRPSADRVREALFQRLGDLAGRRVLDLYAGSGSLGIEALSRGAESVVFIDRAMSSLASLHRNLDALALAERARVVRGDVPQQVARLGREKARFDLVLLDPPYAGDELPRALGAVVRARLLAADGTVVVERGRHGALPELAGLSLVDERRYGDTLIARLRASDPAPAQGAGGGSNCA